MSSIISFYDIESAAGPWSPFTWRVRFALNYKKIPYQTIWVQYPDIKATCEKVGIPHDTQKPDGSLFYTLPAIYDPSTGTALADSTLIAQYLDDTYPDTPKLFPTGSRAPQQALIEKMFLSLPALIPFIIPATPRILNPTSAEYFRTTRAKDFGKKFEDIKPTGAARDEAWAKVKAGFNDMDGWLGLEQAKTDGPYIMGKDCVFIDFVFGAVLMWLKTCFGEESAEWKDIRTWNDGRWEALLNRLKEYQAVV